MSLTPSEQLGLHRRMVRLENSGWEFRAVGDRWAVGVPFAHQHVWGCWEGAHIKVESTSLEAAVCAAEAAQKVFNVCEMSVELNGHEILPLPPVDPPNPEADFV